MARISEPVSMRVGNTTYWEFLDFHESQPENILLKYWLFLSFRKMFEKTRERITLFTDIYMAKYYILIYIVLAITKSFLFLKKKQKLKKRILFSLFKKKKNRLKQHYVKNVRYTQYSKLVNFVLTEKKRFVSFCNLICYKFQKSFLLNLLQTKPNFNFKKTFFFDIPLKLTVKNIFSIIDRNYIYIWKSFYNLVKSQMWYALKARYFVSTLKICFLFMFSPNAQLMVDHLAYLLKNSRKHWQIIKNIQQLFKLFASYLPAFNTVKIRIKGCIQDSERTKYINIGQNFVVTQTFNQPINYAVAHAATPFGALGVKLWVLL